MRYKREVQRVISSISALWRNQKVKLGMGLAALVSIVAALARMTDATDTIASIFEKAETIYRYAATPWLGVMCLALVGILLWRGIKEVVAAQALGRVADQQAHQQQAAAIANALSLPTLIARHEAHAREVREFEADASRNIAFVASEIERWRAFWNAEQRWYGIQHAPFESIRSLNQSWRFVQPIADPVFIRPNPVTSRADIQHSHRYDPAANGVFLQQMEHDFVTAQEWANTVQQSIYRERAATGCCRA